MKLNKVELKAVDSREGDGKVVFDFKVDYSTGNLLELLQAAHNNTKSFSETFSCDHLTVHSTTKVQIGLSYTGFSLYPESKSNDQVKVYDLGYMLSSLNGLQGETVINDKGAVHYYWEIEINTNEQGAKYQPSMTGIDSTYILPGYSVKFVYKSYTIPHNECPDHDTLSHQAKAHIALHQQKIVS